ncbi:hypothetical protein NL676_038793 [Syzygium grande]|nr:hypothetical protein NL676_038793 [Syzygium grande]
MVVHGGSRAASLCVGLAMDHEQLVSVRSEDSSAMYSTRQKGRTCTGSRKRRRNSDNLGCCSNVARMMRLWNRGGAGHGRRLVQRKTSDFVGKDVSKVRRGAAAS